MQLIHKIEGTIYDKQEKFPDQEATIVFRGAGKMRAGFVRYGNWSTSQALREWDGRYAFRPHDGSNSIFASGCNDVLGIAFMMSGDIGN